MKGIQRVINYREYLLRVVNFHWIRSDFIARDQLNVAKGANWWHTKQLRENV